MARKPPPWLFDTHGYDSARWGEAIDEAYRVLLRWAKTGSPGTYTDAVREVRTLDWPEGAWTGHGSQVGDLLGHVSTHEWLDGRPLLSCMAVLGEEGRPSNTPGDGFFRLATQLGFDVGRTSDARFEFWWREVQNCTDEWRSARDFSIPAWRAHLVARDLAPPE